MVNSMKSVDVIQEVKFLYGQRLATSPLVLPAGGGRPMSGARMNKSMGSVLSLVTGSFVDESRGGFCQPLRRIADWFEGQERSTDSGAKAMSDQSHRGRRPGHVDTGITRELERASSVSCLTKARISMDEIHGSLPRINQSSHPERPARSVEPILELKHGDDRYEMPSWIAKASRMDVRQS